jgi:uncharacterized NAD(P)/FAD-binding protein YdhS
MPEYSPEQNYDIAILGGGISCSLTLLHIIRNLLSAGKSQKEITILAVEKQNEFWKGFPYGNRSSINSLTITTLGEFVPEKEKELFISWLESTLDEWISFLEANGGAASRKWIEHNLPLIQKKQWDEIYIPRFLFGNYVDEKLMEAIQFAKTKELARIHLIEAEATSISKKGNAGYTVKLKDKKANSISFVAGKIILAIGSPPVKSIRSATTDDSGPLYIDDLYLPGMEPNIERLEQLFVGITDPNKRNVLIVGSNATSLEFLYLLHSKHGIKKLINKVLAISLSGLLPHRITPNNFSDYKFNNMMLLTEKKNYSSAELIDAIENDIRIADTEGMHIGNIYYRLSDLVVQLLNKLDETQQKNFHSTYGWRLTKLMRRAGAEYSDAAAELMNENKFELLKGEFLDVTVSPTEPGSGMLRYKAHGNEPVIHPLLFPVVINCSGFEELDACSSELINNLIEQGICTVNSTNRGFEVSEKFEASDNFYVVGPLLGGIFNNKIRYWHVENASRIYTIGSMLAEILIAGS